MKGDPRDLDSYTDGHDGHEPPECRNPACSWAGDWDELINEQRGGTLHRTCPACAWTVERMDPEPQPPITDHPF